MLVVSAKKGVTKVAIEHIKLADVFRLPVIFVVTHTDIATEDEVDRTLDEIHATVKEAYPKYPLVVRNDNDIVLLSRTINKENAAPIFLLSNVTGKNMDLFINFLNLLPVKNDYQSQNVDMHTEF